VSFASLPFLLLFLPLTVAGLALARRVGGPGVWRLFLLAVSLVFYAVFSLGGLAVLLISIGFNYAIGVYVAEENRRHRKTVLWTGILGNLALLSAFKYWGALAAGFHMAAPIGLSFYTLAQIGYLADAYAGTIVETHPLRYALFVCGFPHVTSGPILTYAGIQPQITSPGAGRITSERLARGLTLIAIGLFKKVCLAAQMEAIATPVFDAAQRATAIPWLAAVVGATAFSFQLYFDFSGYSDMAVGIGRLCGLDLPWNFDSPYKATNIIDFWQRWHISLTRWLRTYLFTPLTLSLSRLTPSRAQAVSHAYAAGTLLTMLACGVWHGAGWTFAVWGLLHGVLLAGTQAVRDLRRNSRSRPTAPAPARRWAMRAATFGMVTAAWVVFRAPTLDAARTIWWSMLGGNGGFLPNRFPGTAAAWMAASAIVVWGLPNAREWLESTSAGPRSPLASALGLHPWRPNVRIAIAISVLLIYSIMALQGKSEFLYSRF